MRFTTQKIFSLSKIPVVLIGRFCLTTIYFYLVLAVFTTASFNNQEGIFMGSERWQHFLSASLVFLRSFGGGDCPSGWVWSAGSRFLPFGTCRRLPVAYLSGECRSRCDDVVGEWMQVSDRPSAPASIRNELHCFPTVTDSCPWCHTSCIHTYGRSFSEHRTVAKLTINFFSLGHCASSDVIPYRLTVCCRRGPIVRPRVHTPYYSMNHNSQQIIISKYLLCNASISGSADWTQRICR
jgi:hypothetical protein